MKSIDRKIQRSMRERSDQMGALTPPLERPQASITSTVDPYDREPPTRNPSAGQLDYKTADPNEEVLKRLDSYYKPIGPTLELDLEGTFRVAERSAREYRSAEEDYIFAAIRYLIQKHDWGPRFFDDVTTDVNANSNNGDYSVAMNLINELRATQRLPYGGSVEARLVTQAADQLVNIVGNKVQRSSELILSGNIPLLRNAGLIAQEDLIQAERNLVYAARTFERFRRQFLVSIAQDYFDLVTLQSNIRNQEHRLQSVTQLYEQRRALVEAGRQAPFDARNVEQNVKRSQSTLASSNDAFQLAKDRFKVRLGIPVDTELEIKPVTILLPEPGVSVTEAAQLALKYRLDYQNAVDRVGDQKRAVENAKNQILPSLDLTGTVTFGNENVGRGDLAPAFDLNDTDYAFGVTLGLPLDREVERLNLRQATIQLERSERNLAQTRDNLIVDARSAVRETARAQFALQLQEEAIKINQRRITSLEIDQANTTAQQQLDAQDNLLQSQNDRDQALRDLRVAILNYLLSTGQMRVAPDGTFQPLQGMVLRHMQPQEPYEPPSGLTPGGKEMQGPPAPIPELAPAVQGVEGAGGAVPGEVPGAPPAAGENEGNRGERPPPENPPNTTGGAKEPANADKPGEQPAGGAGGGADAGSG